MMRRLSASLFVSISLATVGGWLQGQDEVSGREAEIEQLQSQIAELKGDESIPEVARNADVSNLQEAITFLQKTDEFVAREAQFKEVLANGARDISRMQAEATALDESREGSLLPANITEESEMALIEVAISQEQVSLTDARAELNSITASIAENKASPTTIRDRLIAVRAEIVEIEASLNDLESGDVDAQSKSKLIASKARRDALMAESSMLDQESLSYDIRVAKSGAAKGLAEKRIEVIYDRIGALQDLANVRLVSEVDRAEALFRRVQKIAPDADASVATLSSELETLIRETRNVSSQLESTAVRLQEREALLRSITADFDSVKRQIEIGGLEGSFARILLERRRTIPGALEERQLIRQIRQDLSEAQRSLYFLENHSAGDTGEVVESAADAAGNDSAETKILQKEARELSDTRDRLRQDLIANYRRLIRELGELDLVEQQIDQESTEYRDFLAEQLFWIRSSPVIGSQSFQDIVSGLNWAVGPHRFGDLLRNLAAIPLWYYIVSGIFLGALIIGRKRFEAELLLAGNQTRRISTDHYYNTVKAFVVTFLLALPIPFVFFVFGVAFRNHSGATEWSFGLGTALSAISVFMMMVTFTRALAREKGLGEYHFKWSRTSLDRVRRLFSRLVPIYIPLCVVLCLVVSENNPQHFDGLGRLTSIFFVAGIGTTFILFTKPELDGEAGASKSGYIFFNNRFLFWINTFATVGLLFLLVVGFVITALLLMIELQMTILVIYLAFIVHGMILRWFEIKERRMALAEAIAERQARREAAEEEEEEGPHESEEMLIDETEEDQQLDLVEVGEQTRNVIRFVVGVGLVVTLWYLWTELAPVLSVLDAIRLVGDLSIADLAVTTLVIAATVSITRNLGGLMEMLVLRRLNIIPGTRSAIITLVKYAVIAIGAMVVFGQIGVDWSKFGWIATALSVGLGFGLQEVVANFICGIILLFERPIRVGDVVTVAGVSGTVSKIQMRATTIVNFDREEFVVPNKEFITGSLINMTLSSPINRIMIPVGVAYGSDTEEVLRILSEVAREVEDVMDDPAPVITFESFGDSSLDFTIRAFLPSRENRLGVITEMHRRIDQRFSKAGIEIPFPQRDLHLRSVDEGVDLGGKPDS